MVPAQIAVNIRRNIRYLAAFVAIILLVAALVGPQETWAATGGPQECTASSTCTIGEFLYDDNYLPIATATCRITSRDPSGNLYIDNTLMTPASDGWYSYQFTASSTTGDYRTQVCCTVGTDDLCIDKSFRIVSSTTTASSGDIASAVWSYSNRTLSSFGTLTRDIWLNTTRTLTSLVTNSQSTTSDTDDLSEIKKTVKENRLLLEELVNKPIIQNFIEEEDTPDLNTKIKESKVIANHLFANYQFIISKTGYLTSKWPQLSDSELLDSVMEINNIIGEESDSTSTDTVFGQINWLKDSWDWDVNEDIFKLSKDSKKTYLSIQRQLGTKGKSNFSFLEIKSISKSLNTGEKLLGNASNTSTQKTLFGRLKQVEDLAKILDQRRSDVDKILANWDQEKNQDIQAKIGNLLKKVLAINKLPKVNLILSAINEDKPEEVKQKNKVLTLAAIIDSNKMLLAAKPGKALSTTWLEEGSVIFKSLITNPSTLISQDVPLKYYLPPEVREEHIIDTSDGLKAGYDTEKDQYFVEGEFNLKAGETITVTVTVDDIWQITDEEIESLRTQASELSKPLEKTSFFAQGVTLKSDIDASLDKVLALRKTGVTPEAKIRAYREAQIEFVQVKEKLDKLQELVTQAGSAGTFFGFVGGAQTLAVWGLIIIMITGFVFLVIYMRTLGVRDAENKLAKNKKKIKKEGKNGKLAYPKQVYKPQSLIRAAMPFVFVAVVSASVSGSITGLIISAKFQKQSQEEVVGEENQVDKLAEDIVVDENKDDNHDQVLAEETQNENSGIGGEEIVKVVVPINSKVNVREEPNLKAKVITKFSESQEVVKIGEEGDWINIVFENEGISDTVREGVDTQKESNILPDISSLEGWVHEDFVEGSDNQELEETFETDDNELDISEESLEKDFESSSTDDLSDIGGYGNDYSDRLVTISDTETSWLRVRKSPWGDEIAKVYPGETYALLEERSDWFQIELEDGTNGWIYSKYASVE